jgi:hypothetical protein
MQMLAAQSRIQHDTCVDPACTAAREISIQTLGDSARLQFCLLLSQGLQIQ